MLELELLRSLTKRENYYKSKDLLKSEFFSTQCYKQLFRLIEDYWSSTTDTPVLSRDTFSALVEIHLDKEDQAIAKASLQSLFSEEPGEDSDLLLDKVARRWGVGALLGDALEAYQRGELDTQYLGQALMEVVPPGQSSCDLDLSPVEEGEDLLIREFTGKVYPTGLTKMDKQLDGGLWEGELGVILAPSFRGKTQALCHFGAVALNGGIDVQHHTHEISRSRTAIRYYQNLLDVPRSWIRRHPGEAASKVNTLDLPLWSIRDWSANQVTTGEIRRAVREFCDKGANRPLVLVDYLDEIRAVGAERSNRQDTNLTLVASELRQIACEFGVGIWTASQVQRAAWSHANIYMHDVAESIGKVTKADVVISMNANMEEQDMGVLQFYIAKAREREITDPFVGTINEKDKQRFIDCETGLV